MKTKLHSITKTPEGYVVADVKKDGVGACSRFGVVRLFRGHEVFLSGAGSVFDLGGTRLGNIRLGTTLTDNKALVHDFSAIGRDMKDLLGDQLSYLER